MITVLLVALCSSSNTVSVTLRIYTMFLSKMSSAGVYLSLNATIIPDHGYVVISDIGSTDDTALICHTNRSADFTNYRGFHSGGDWFAPDETTVSFDGNDVPGFRRNRSPMIVRLLRNTATDPPSEGIYHCLVKDDIFTLRTIDVGLYNSGEGTCT